MPGVHMVIATAAAENGGLESVIQRGLCALVATLIDTLTTAMETHVQGCITIVVFVVQY